MTMQISRLKIENFRTLSSIEIELHPRANVFAGINGSGKSTLMDAIYLLFIRYTTAMRTGKIAGRGPNLSELRKGAKQVHIEAAAVNDGQEFSWWIKRTFSGLHSRVTNQNLGQFREFIREQLNKLEEPRTANIPLFAIYPVGRAVLDIPLRVRSKEDNSQAVAFSVSGLQGARHFRSFFAWFRDREDYENERRVRTPSFRDVQLSAVRSAIERLMPGFQKLRVARRPLRMIVAKGNVEYEISSLSDGEKGLLALVGDLARRLSLCNPGLSDPLDGQGIVLIDELELHLHPGWQRSVAHGFVNVFRNIQFFFTTHSPQVISEFEPEQIFLLSGGRSNSAKRSYGMESSQILRELMGDPGRPQAIGVEIDKLHRKLDADDLDASQRILGKLEASIGADDPALQTARTRLRRNRVLSKRATHR